MVTSVPKLQPPSQKGIGLGNDFDYSADFVEEARKCYPAINYDSAPAREYRRMISDFYNYVKENGTPSGQPEAKIALAKGYLDLGASAAGFHPNAAKSGMVCRPAGTRLEYRIQRLFSAPECNRKIRRVLTISQKGGAKLCP